jgi:tRNA modification GTPase
VLELAQRDGFEVMQSAAGVFPEIATDGRTTLEREVLAHLPCARTELGLRVLLAQERAWDELSQQLRKAIGASSDTREKLSHELRAILSDRSLHHLLNPPRVAIVGAPNVGKSTLANQLFAQERSIAADLPGTTRDWVGEIANINGLPVMLVDTPGLRETDDSIEHAAIQRSRGEIERADLVVLVLDASRPLEPEQQPLLAVYPDALKVANKVDRTMAWDLITLKAIPTIGTTGKGIDVLRQSIATYFGCEEMDLSRARYWTGRQKQILERALSDPQAT